MASFPPSPPISIRDMLLSRLAEKPGGRSSVTSVRDVELEILEVVGIGSIIASCARGYYSFLDV